MLGLWLPSPARGAPAAGTVAVPPERSIDWSLAGIPGGIPRRGEVCAILDAAAYGDGTADATAAIQQALDRCPAGQVVVLPAGSYRTSDTIHVRTDKTLRGAGPSRTEIRYQGPATRSVLDMRGSVYWDVYGLHRTYGIPVEARKGDREVVLDSVEGIAVGDVLLLDQRNDAALVDAVGSEGPCTWCSRQEGGRARGQYAEVEGIRGRTVELGLPLFLDLSPALAPEAVLISARSLVRRAGVEDLALTQAEPVNDYIVEMDGAQHCWLQNVEISGMHRRGVWLIESLQSQVRHCTFRDAVTGYGRDRGYGLLIDAQSTANLAEDNLFHSVDGGGMMTAGGAIGNVLAYNYLPDIRFDDYWWMIAGPVLNHAAHPSMNLWEGNIGPQIGGDFIHGSSSHQTVFRSYSAGWKEETATANNNAVDLQYKNRFMTVIGCVLGTPGRSDTYEQAWPEARSNQARTIWRLGYGGPGGAGETDVRDTLLRHGNWDAVTGATVWDPTLSERVLPPSLYLSAAPPWWGSLPWPPIGPDREPMVGPIPAQLRHEAAGPTAAPASPTPTHGAPTAAPPTPTVDGPTPPGRRTPVAPGATPTLDHSAPTAGRVTPTPAGSGSRLCLPSLAGRG